MSIGSTGHKNLYIALGLGGSSLDAKGGIVGGNIEIAHINTYSEYYFNYFVKVHFHLESGEVNLLDYCRTYKLLKLENKKAYSLVDI